MKSLDEIREYCNARIKRLNEMIAETTEIQPLKYLTGKRKAFKELLEFLTNKENI